MATPSLLIIPDRYKAGVLYSQLPESGAGDLDFSRASTATRVNASGLIESVASGVPRLDYTGGGCPSLLLEPQRTNLFLNSASGATQSITVTEAAHTLSFYGTGSIELSGVASGTLEGIGTGVANRVSLTFTPTAGSLTLTVSGTITDVQLEEGSYPTSYIPTTASSVTRLADDASKTGISSLIGQTEGVLFCDVVLNERVSFTYFAIAPDISSAANYIGIAFLAGSILLEVVISSAVTTTITLSNSATGRFKVAAAYKQNDFALYVNGTQVGTSTSGNVLACSELGLSQYDKSQSMRYNAAALYPVRLSNSELAALTAL